MPLPGDPIPGRYYYCDHRQEILQCKSEWDAVDRTHGFRTVYPPTGSDYTGWVNIAEDSIWHLIEINDDMSMIAFITEIEDCNAGKAPSDLSTSPRIGDRA